MGSSEVQAEHSSDNSSDSETIESSESMSKEVAYGGSESDLT